MLYNPLEQFEVNSLTGGAYSVLQGTGLGSITNMGIAWGMILVVIIVLLRCSGGVGSSPSADKWSIGIETLVTSILGMIKDQIGVKGKELRYYPLIVSIFVVILISNVLGMIPYSFTPTSHIVVTIGFSIAIMIGVSIIGIERYKTEYFSLFVPSGTPIVLVPLLTLIELISYTARAFSLALRLSVNVTAGHSLFGVISMLSYSAAKLSGGGIISTVGPLVASLALLIPLYGLEIVVGILQAYVFTLLTISYLRDAALLH